MRSIARRNFLASCAAGTSLAAVGLKAVHGQEPPGGPGGDGGGGGPDGPPPESGSDTEYERYQHRIGDVFHVTSAEGQVDMILERVDVRWDPDDLDRPPELRLPPFSLLFVAPGGEYVESQICLFDHATLGLAELFVHEVLWEGLPECRYYEVVFD